MSAAEAARVILDAIRKAKREATFEGKLGNLLGPLSPTGRRIARSKADAFFDT
jgi:hypothetical protein